jgi:hypothetical protein
VSDLSVYAGGLLRQRAPGCEVAPLMRDTIDALLDEAGTPAEAGGEYPDHAQRVRARVALFDWSSLSGEDWPFSQSQDALVYWAPVMDELKQLDEEIVRNSVRFRWREVREELGILLDAAALAAEGGAAARSADGRNAA